jgi:hypothetical protein
VRVNERAFAISDLVISDEQSSARTPGTHVSDIIRHIDKAMNKEKDNKFTEDDLELFAIIGRMWEAQISKAMLKPPRYERIGEIECDGIIMSPDSIDTVEWSLQEFKVTWRSARRTIESEFKWLTQVKAYCYALGMCRVSIYALYVCGTYQPPVPIPKAWDLLFSPSELQDNWAMLLRNKEECHVST